MSWYLGHGRAADKMSAAWILGVAAICSAVGLNSMGFWGIFLGPILGALIVGPWFLLGWLIKKK